MRGASGYFRAAFPASINGQFCSLARDTNIQLQFPTLHPARTTSITALAPPIGIPSTVKMVSRTFSPKVTKCKELTTDHAHSQASALYKQVLHQLEPDRD